MRRGAPSLRAPSRGRMRTGAPSLEARLCAALQGEEDAMVEALLQHGANPNLVLPGGIAAIHLAAGVEQASGIRCLARILQYGGDPNARSVDGLTPVHVAASWGHCARLQLLLREGGNPHLQDQEGNTALELALKHGSEQCVRVLRGCPAEGAEAESSWTSQRRAESFLSTMSEDDSGFPAPPPALLGRTPEGETLHPDGPGGRFFPCVGAAAEDGREAPSFSEEDWQPPSFLTECSWQDTTLPDHQCELPPRTAPLHGPLVPSAAKTAPEYAPADGVWDARAASQRSEAPSQTRHSRCIEDPAEQGGGWSPGPSVASGSSPESPPSGGNPEILRTAGSQEVSEPPLPSTGNPERHAGPDRWDPDATLNLTHYSSFLDPALVVKLSHHEGLDVTSPDHAYLFSRDSPAALSELEKTVVGPAFLSGGCSGTGEPCGRYLDGGSLYASCHSHCGYVSALDVSGCSQARECGDQQASFAHSPGHSPGRGDSPPWLTPLHCRGLCCDALRASPEKSSDEVPMWGGACGGEAPSGMSSEKPPRHAQGSEGGALTPSPSQKEGSRDRKTRPLQEPQPLKTSQAGKEFLPGAAWGEGVAAQEPRDEGGGKMRVPNGRAALEEEEEEGVAERGETPWAQETVLIQRPPADSSPSPSGGGTLLPGTSEGLTLPVLDPTGSEAGEEPDGLEAKLRSLMLASKIRHSPLVRSHSGPVTLRAAAPGRDGSSSSLFEESLEMPRRPRRMRSPEAKTPPAGQEPHPLGSDAPFVSAAPSSSRPGSWPSPLSPAGPAVPMAFGQDVSENNCCCPDASASMGGSADVKPDVKPAGERDCSSPRSSERPCPSPDVVAAAPPWTQPEWPAVTGGRAQGPPRRSRVSFSRLSVRGPPGPPTAAAGLPERLSPVSQAVPLSPGGRPVNGSAAEPVEYLYVDEEGGHRLVERHVPCTDDSLADTTAGSEDTLLYDWRACAPWAAPQAGPLSDEALVRQLRDLGVNPGPVTGLTRKLYRQLLEKLLSDPATKARKATSGYSPELSSALETYQIPDGQGDEMALAGPFDRPDKSRKWREGLLKSSFNYLLLDPRVTQNLPFRAQFVSRAECFRTFVGAVFYVGKGKRSRPYSHLYEALDHFKGRGRPPKQACAKVRHILEIWASGQGVVSLHCFQNVIPVEAYTREACMVDAIGLTMLTNQKKGNYYGVVASWPLKRRRALGVHLLHRAMRIFLAEGERQLRPADIQAGQ